MASGRCHCGAIGFEAEGEPAYHAICHCADCRHHAGAPMVAWAAFPAAAVTVRGEPRTYSSSEHGRRLFCGDCGTSLFYTNEQALPGLFDIQSATFDDPSELAPAIHVQTAERLPWTAHMEDMPKFERYPSPE
ncbi:MAG: GFA family protein [Sphingosinicella sp.]